MKKKQKEINDKIKFLENTEDLLESEQIKLNQQKTEISKSENNLKNEIQKLNIEKNNLNNQIQQLKNQIQNLNQMINNRSNNNMNNINMMNIMSNNSNNNIPMNNQMNQNNIIMCQMNNNINNIPMNNNINNINIFKQKFINPINNKQNFNSFNPKKPIETYSTPTLTGLQNIGATCFMNATIQCLSQTEDLSNYFLNPTKQDKIINNNIAKENPRALQLSPVYLSLVKELWNKNKYKGYINPDNFMKTIESMNSLFKLGEPGDSKDFIIFLLEQFHRELKKNLGENNNNNEQQVNQYDQKESFEYFIKEFSKDTSIISDIFFGILETTNICQFCQRFYSNQRQNYPICYNYQIFNCIIFPLEKVKNYKNQKNNLNRNNNSVTLYDCFDQQRDPEKFTGDNKNYCNICSQLYDSLYTTRIYSSPTVLVLILNRGKNNMYNIKLDFYESIDITNYVTMKQGKLIYNLQGVITHFGQSGPNAHFLAFSKSPVDKKWYRYNDATVTDVKDLKKDVIDFGTPYILFYQKLK